MTDTNRKKTDDEAPAPDVMHGRSLAGASYGANEREQTEDARRGLRDKADEAGEFVTDGELEAREGSSANDDEISP